MADSDYTPTHNQTPTAIAECPHCSGLINVALRGRPPAATIVGTGVASFKTPSHCPHCYSRIWMVLRARPPIALPPDAAGTALLPKPIPGINRNATTRTEEDPPPPLT